MNPSCCIDRSCTREQSCCAGPVPINTDRPCCWLGVQARRQWRHRIRQSARRLPFALAWSWRRLPADGIDQPEGMLRDEETHHCLQCGGPCTGPPACRVRERSRYDSRAVACGGRRAPSDGQSLLPARASLCAAGGASGAWQPGGGTGCPTGRMCRWQLWGSELLDLREWPGAWWREGRRMRRWSMRGQRL